MSEESKAEFYGIGDPDVLVHEDRDECIEAYLDSTHPEPFPDTVTVVSYQRMTVGAGDVDPEGIAEVAIERLEEEYGGEDHEQPLEVVAKIGEAAQAFAEAVAKVYESWACEPCGEEEVVDVKAWVAEHCPHWLVDSERGVLGV